MEKALSDMAGFDPTRDELLDALEGMVRIVEAVRYTQQLGKTQLDRLEKAKALIKKVKS